MNAKELDQKIRELEQKLSKVQQEMRLLTSLEEVEKMALKRDSIINKLNELYDLEMPRI